MTSRSASVWSGVVWMVPYVTGFRRLPSASMTPKPQIAVPGSIPIARIFTASLVFHTYHKIEINRLTFIIS